MDDSRYNAVLMDAHLEELTPLLDKIALVADKVTPEDGCPIFGRWALGLDPVTNKLIQALSSACGYARAKGKYESLNLESLN